jgi:hypothetical protein
VERRVRHSSATGAAHRLAVRILAAAVVATTAWLAMRSVPEAQAVSSGALVVAKGRAVKQVAVDGRRLAWEAGPLEGDSGTTLYVRGLPGGRKHVLARDVISTYGLALAAGWVVYAEGGSPARLVAISPRGARKLLSRSLATPLAARGSLLAWIERVGRRQRVVVRDMRTGRVRLVSVLRRCERGHCYQLGEVALADRGVVFTRISSNPDLSWVVRVRFSNRVLTSVRIPNDPQPDLVPSSAGALYYAYRRGWYRWDFGKRPRGTRFRANPPAPVLAYEHGRWFLSTRRGCDFGVVSVGASGRRDVVVSPRRLRSLVPSTSRSCVWLQAFASAGRRPLSAWALVPRESSEEHSDRGLFGVAIAGRAAR